MFPDDVVVAVACIAGPAWADIMGTVCSVWRATLTAARALPCVCRVEVDTQLVQPRHVRLDATSMDPHVPYCLYAQLRLLSPCTETLRVDWHYSAPPPPLRTVELGATLSPCNCHVRTIVECLAHRITGLEKLQTLHVDLTQRGMPYTPMVHLIAALRESAHLMDVTLAVCTCDVQSSVWVHNLWRLSSRWNAFSFHLKDNSVGATNQAFKLLANSERIRPSNCRPSSPGLRRLSVHLECKRQMNQTVAHVLAAIDRFAGTVRHLALTLRETQSWGSSWLAEPALGAFALRTLELDVSDSGLSAAGMVALLDRFATGPTLVRLRVRAERNEYNPRFWTILCASLTATQFPALRSANFHLAGNRCGLPPAGALACLVAHDVSNTQRTFVSMSDDPMEDDDAVWM